jgi:hypothetical protein
MFVCRFAFVLSAIIATLTSAAAQLSSLPEIDFSSLSQSDPNPLGARALAIRPGEWKHAETDHFVYHFFHGYVATPVSVEAEFYYRVIVKELERDPPGGDTKSHIYIFEKPEDWHAFQKLGQLEPWTGGIHSMGSLFIQRNPSYRFSNSTLGHEIAHLIMHRYYPDGIPRWLDEGFAQYVATSAHASYRRARGYIAKPHSSSIPVEKLLPIQTLVAMVDYPSGDDQVAAFYGESERLVRFLAGTDKSSFLGLLDALSRHQPFERMLLTYYSGKFGSMTALDAAFSEYAANEFAIPDGSEPAD